MFTFYANIFIHSSQRVLRTEFRPLGILGKSYMVRLPYSLVFSNLDLRRQGHWAANLTFMLQAVIITLLTSIYKAGCTSVTNANVL